MTKQYTLPFTIYDACTDFILSTSNQDAYMALEKWPNSLKMLCIVGPASSGKTCLIHTLFSEYTCIDHGDDLIQFLNDGCPQRSVIIDNADKTIVANEEAFFHIYNHVYARHGNLLLMARTAPASWPLQVKDVISRLKTLPCVYIRSPDDALITALLQKEFSRLQVRVNPHTLNYIVMHAERSYKGIISLCKTLNDLSLSLGKKISIPLVREVLTCTSQ